MAALPPNRALENSTESGLPLSLDFEVRTDENCK